MFYILFLIIPTINCAVVTPNYQSSCALVQDSIYCYSGGYIPIGDTGVHSTSDEFHALDLTQTLSVNTDQWSCLRESDYSIESAMGSSIALVSNTSFILDGGYSRNVIINATKVYATENDQWTTISEANRSSQDPIYSGTAVNVPNQGQIYYWGGLYGNETGNQVTNTTILNIQSMTWLVNADIMPPNTFSRNGHTATLDIDGIHIIYMGGKITQFGKSSLANIKDILFYNTIDASWTLKQSNTSLNISDRYLHTATPIPLSSKILIYGGANISEKAVPDYLYSFDTQTLEFLQLYDRSSYFDAGPRYGHSAILYKNTLFIIFGVNQKGIPTNDLRFLSLKNQTVYTWLKSYNETTTALSTPAIVGLSVGLVVAVAIIILAIIIVYRKKKGRKNVDIDDMPPLYHEYTCTPTKNEQEVLGEKPHQITRESSTAQSPSTAEDTTITIIKVLEP